MEKFKNETKVNLALDILLSISIGLFITVAIFKGFADEKQIQLFSNASFCGFVVWINIRALLYLFIYSKHNKNQDSFYENGLSTKTLTFNELEQGGAQQK